VLSPSSFSQLLHTEVFMQHSFYKEQGRLVTEVDLYGPWPLTPKIFQNKEKKLNFTLNFIYFFSFTLQFFFSFNLAPYSRGWVRIYKPRLDVRRQELFFNGRRPPLVSVVTRRSCVVLSCTAVCGQHAPRSVLLGLAREGHSLHIRLCLVSIWASGGRSMLEGFPK
jgi:hypothetical protein